MTTQVQVKRKTPANAPKPKANSSKSKKSKPFPKKAWWTVRREQEKAKNDAQSKKTIDPQNINWDLVDLDAIQSPAPRFPEPKLHYEDGRTFFKHPHSRKVYMHSMYVNMLLLNPIILFFDMHKVDTHTILNLRLALASHNAETKVIRRRVFTSALRVAKYLETTRPGPNEMWDPSGLAIHAKLLPRKRSMEELEMKALLKGQQPCAVYFNGLDWRSDQLDPAKIVAVMRILEKTGKTPILGARFQRKVVMAEDLKQIRDMESLEQSRLELVALLGGNAQTLVGTLSSPSGSLALTLEGRKKAMDEGEK